MVRYLRIALQVLGPLAAFLLVMRGLPACSYRGSAADEVADEQTRFDERNERQLKRLAPGARSYSPHADSRRPTF